MKRGTLGLAIGLGAMLLVMAAIWITQAATITPSGQTLGEALRNGAAWIILEIFVGASEKIFYRGALYLAVAVLLGWRVAIFVSGLLFLVLHVGNPSASPIWLIRIALSGMLLAYAVHRTQSIWWSVGYHMGWNWISAPLFGAPGSGYMDDDHILNYAPHGPDHITGGVVGPERIIFAMWRCCLRLQSCLSPRFACRQSLKRSALSERSDTVAAVRTRVVSDIEEHCSVW